MAIEPFDIKKLLGSFGNPLYWVKCIMFGFGIGFLLFLWYGVYKAYFKKPLPTSSTHIIAEPGSTVDARTYVIETKKKIETFAEPFVQIDTHGEFMGGLRAGLRF